MTFKLTKKVNKQDSRVRHMTKALNSNSKTPVEPDNIITNCEVTREVGTEVEMETVSWQGKVNQQSPRIPMIDFSQQVCAEELKSLNFVTNSDSQIEEMISVDMAIAEVQSAIQFKQDQYDTIEVVRSLVLPIFDKQVSMRTIKWKSIMNDVMIAYKKKIQNRKKKDRKKLKTDTSEDVDSKVKVTKKSLKFFGQNPNGEAIQISD